jgi:hypothetical protein
MPNPHTSDEPESGPTAALSCERSDRARRKLHCTVDCFGPSLGLLQPDILLCPMDDTSVEDSEQASAASTVPLLATLLSFLRGLRPDLPRHRRRKSGTVRAIGNYHNFLPSTLESTYGSLKPSPFNVPERI